MQNLTGCSDPRSSLPIGGEGWGFCLVQCYFQRDHTSVSAKLHLILFISFSSSDRHTDGHWYRSSSGSSSNTAVIIYTNLSDYKKKFRGRQQQLQKRQQQNLSVKIVIVSTCEFIHRAAAVQWFGVV